MARLYANENFPLPTVEALRRFGHDVLTTVDSGRAGEAIPDAVVLAFAIAELPSVVTLNRRHFIQLHHTTPEHAGIVVCTFDPDFAALALRIHTALEARPQMAGQLVHVNRPAESRLARGPLSTPATRDYCPYVGCMCPRRLRAKKSNRMDSQAAEPKRLFTIIYAPITRIHLRAIEANYYSLIRTTIQEHLSSEPDVTTRKRKPLKRPAFFEATWELRLGPENRFRVFYDLDHQKHVVAVLAIGIKGSDGLLIGSEEIRL